VLAPRRRSVASAPSPCHVPALAQRRQGVEASSGRAVHLRCITVASWSTAVRLIAQGRPTPRCYSLPAVRPPTDEATGSRLLRAQPTASDKQWAHPNAAGGRQQGKQGKQGKATSTMAGAEQPGGRHATFCWQWQRCGRAGCTPDLLHRGRPSAQLQGGSEGRRVWEGRRPTVGTAIAGRLSEKATAAGEPANLVYLLADRPGLVSPRPPAAIEKGAPCPGRAQACEPAAGCGMRDAVCGMRACVASLKLLCGGALRKPGLASGCRSDWSSI